MQIGKTHILTQSERRESKYTKKTQNHTPHGALTASRKVVCSGKKPFPSRKCDAILGKKLFEIHIKNL